MSKIDTAEFVCAHTTELARLAQAADLHLLAVMLEMTALEARSQAGRTEQKASLPSSHRRVQRADAHSDAA